MSTTNKKLPTPEELQREFEAFLKQKYGDSVKFSVSSPNVESEPTLPPPPKKRTAADLKFDYKPKEVKQYLDRFIIKQDEGKKALAIGVCDHYNHGRNTRICRSFFRTTWSRNIKCCKTTKHNFKHKYK